MTDTPKRLESVNRTESSTTSKGTHPANHGGFGAAALTISVLISGCFTNTERMEPTADPADQQLRDEIRAKRPSCQTDVECAALWEAVKSWAVHYPHRTHMTVKPDRISVEGIDGSMNVGMDMYLKRSPDGSGYVETRMFCADNGAVLFPLPCRHEPEALILQMENAVSQGH